VLLRPHPQRDGHAFEVKWDGFRAIVGRNGDFAIRSRRGWDMTSLLPELEALPVHAILDGEASLLMTTVVLASPACDAG
jgi:ATP-dependent DNA ligase